LIDADVALVFTLGDNMRALDAALPTKRRGGHASSVLELAELLRKALRPGDVVTVKGSHGSHIHELVKKLVAAPATACAVKG
jgi:UDP-N-acetylmuramoyl-tripeptide--D-alanyl-D-alanine ligase